MFCSVYTIFADNFILKKSAHVLRYGFARIYKSVMTTPNLTARAKGLFAGLAAVAYNFDEKHRPYIVTATVKQLAAKLNISSDSIRGYMAELIREGYVVMQHNTRDGHYLANTYWLVPYAIHRGAEDVLPAPATVLEHNLRNRITAECTAENEGYGVLPVSVMCDESIDLTSMAVYAYLSSFAGSSDTATPSLKDIKNHLNISRETYASHRGYLEKKGYITVSQSYGTNGQFGICYVTINDNPAENDTPKKRSFIPKPMRKKPMRKKAINKDKEALKELHKQSSKGLTPETTETKSEEKKISPDDIRQMLDENRGLTENMVGEYENAVTAAEILTEDIRSSQPVTDAVTAVFADAVVDLLTKETCIGGESVTPDIVAEKINGVIRSADPYTVAGSDTAQAALSAFYSQLVKPSYEAQAAIQEIHSPARYMAAVIWDKLTASPSDSGRGGSVRISGKTTSMPDLMCDYDRELLDSLFV